MPEDTTNPTETTSTPTSEAPESEAVDTAVETPEVPATEATPQEKIDPLADLARAMLMGGGRQQQAEQPKQELPAFALPSDIVSKAVEDLGDPIKPVLSAIEKAVTDSIRARDERIAALEGAHRQSASERAANAQQAVAKMLGSIDESAYGNGQTATSQQQFAAQQTIALAQELQARISERGAFMSDDRALRAAHAAIFGSTTDAKDKKAAAVKARAGQVMPAPGERGGSGKAKAKVGDDAALDKIRAWKARKNG